ncbi:MAG: arginine--tRNA ligase [Candidatus Thermoplasmatota archaeon]
MIYPLETCKREITSALSKTISLLYHCDTDIKLETPPSPGYGDYTYPCFPLASKAKKSPKDIAEEIVKKVEKNRWITHIEAKNGYINIFLNMQHLAEETLKTILKMQDRYGTLPAKKKRIIIEHTSANPNGPLHVGRARNPIIGDTLVRLHRFAGYDVESQFYLDDMGKQVAILTYGIKHVKPEIIPSADIDKPDHRYVGFYQIANKMMEEDERIQEEINEIIRKAETGDKKTLQMIKEAYTPVIEGIKQSLKRINITIDIYIEESTFVIDKSVNKIIDELRKTTYCNEEDGALYLDLAEFDIKGRNTRFYLTRRDGTTLYATRDIAYHKWKADHADELINVLGEDHKLEAKQVEIALKLLGVKKIPRVIFYAFVSLPEGKMSTRRGRVVYLDELIDEAVTHAYEEVKKRRGDELSETQMSSIAEIVGIGALRFNIIKIQPEKDIVFKWEDALNFEGNSAPFIQYAHARACSILAKNTEKTLSTDIPIDLHPTERELILQLSRFPEFIEKATNECKPHILASYLLDIASAFNQFYRDCPVLTENDNEKRNMRIRLVDAVRITLKNGLELLGITAPIEM